MALLSLIFRKPQKAQIGVMQLDASLNETHSRVATVTNNPIEDGSLISDHITLEPIKLVLQGVVSDTPLNLQQSVIGAGAGAVTDVTSNFIGGLGATALSLGAGSVAGLVSNRTTFTAIDSNGNEIETNSSSNNDAFKYLEELYFNRTPFTVVTKLKKYESMVITSLDVPRNAQTAGGLQFTVNLQQVKIVKSATVKVPEFQLASNARASGQSTARLGKQATKEIKDGTETSERTKSYLASLADSVPKIGSLF